MARALQGGGVRAGCPMPQDECPACGELVWRTTWHYHICGAETKLHDREWMAEQYAIRSAGDIAKELGMSRGRVLRALEGHGIPKRWALPPGAETKLQDRDWLEAQYATKGAREIAKELGTTQGKVLGALERHGIPKRARGQKPGEENQPRPRKVRTPKPSAQSHRAAERARWRHNIERNLAEREQSVRAEFRSANSLRAGDPELEIGEFLFDIADMVASEAEQSREAGARRKTDRGLPSDQGPDMSLSTGNRVSEVGRKRDARFDNEQAA